MYLIHPNGSECLDDGTTISAGNVTDRMKRDVPICASLNLEKDLEIIFPQNS